LVSIIREKERHKTHGPGENRLGRLKKRSCFS
jgi:hypothetical protein